MAYRGAGIVANILLMLKKCSNARRAERLHHVRTHLMKYTQPKRVGGRAASTGWHSDAGGPACSSLLFFPHDARK
ncbi:Hypothetical protein GbCGDNIH4_1532 [Granulibacter bethesdensis CGDNIH4]|nr:Hypothetical protein GbCGDNIH4_1532 [Granulibacter bethesdensis CGDNIH4]